MSKELATQYSFSDLEKMAAAIAASGLFGLRDSRQALGLMLLCQAEGLHPAVAARDYHIIEGKPALKSDAMLARFQAAGGRVEFLTYTDREVKARFSHPSGGSLEVSWTIDQAKTAHLTERVQKDGRPNMWQKYPRQMLRARVISEGIRSVYPGVLVGVYTPEEVADFDPKPANVAEIIEEPEAEELVTPKQVQALAIALKSAGFSSDEEGKATGRSFLAFLAGRAPIASVKELTRIEAQRVLDRLGSGENGNYRTQEELVDEALAAWSASKMEVEVVEAEVARAS